MFTRRFCGFWQGGSVGTAPSLHVILRGKDCAGPPTVGEILRARHARHMTVEKDCPITHRTFCKTAWTPACAGVTFCGRDWFMNLLPRICQGLAEWASTRQIATTFVFHSPPVLFWSKWMVC